MPVHEIEANPDPSNQAQYSSDVGTKRKLDDHADDAMDTDIFGQSELRVKRQCQEVYPDPVGDNGVVLSHQHQQHFMAIPTHSFNNTTLTQVQHIDDRDIHGCMKDVAVCSRMEPGSLSSSGFQPLGSTYLTQHHHHHPDHHHTHSSPSLPSAHESVKNVGGQCMMLMDMDGETYSPMAGQLSLQTDLDSTDPLSYPPVEHSQMNS